MASPPQTAHEQLLDHCTICLDPHSGANRGRHRKKSGTGCGHTRSRLGNGDGTWATTAAKISSHCSVLFSFSSLLKSCAGDRPSMASAARSRKAATVRRRDGGNAVPVNTCSGSLTRKYSPPANWWNVVSRCRSCCSDVGPGGGAMGFGSSIGCSGPGVFRSESLFVVTTASTDRSAEIARLILLGRVTVVIVLRLTGKLALRDLVVQSAQRPALGGGALQPVPLDFGIVDGATWR